jgi:hypothetical protein
MGKMNYTPIHDEDKWPICPYCDSEIKEMKYFEQTGVIRQKVVRIFVCPHCLKVLGNGMVGF